MDSSRFEGIRPFIVHSSHIFGGRVQNREGSPTPLNPKVWEAVKEEILKWLNAEIIYPISDSQWVSPVHVVPKKAGVTMTVNDKGEEIQTRLPTK